ncbi:MAG TPA: anti-sigma regulatory factor [Limnobacter sp.]|nr:anti-sigma regulatory factor [Limnobacter sp.]
MNRLPFHGALKVLVESDIAAAIRLARHAAEQIGFSKTDVGYISTAAAELASNLFIHAQDGEFEVHTNSMPAGICLQTRDSGPGIADISLALKEGYSTAGGLGCGLPGVKRLMDTLQIDSSPDRPTFIRAEKWI